MKKYTTVTISDEIAKLNADLLSNAEFEVDEAFEKGNFNLEDRTELTKIISKLNEMRKKQVDLIGSGKKEY